MIEPDARATIEDLSRYANTPENRFTRLYQQMMRDARFLLERDEWDVLMFIFDRTVPFGKVVERIPEDHFLAGVWQGTTLIAAPVKLSRAQLYRVLKRLDDNGIIIRQPIKRGRAMCYGINELCEKLKVSPRDIERLPQRHCKSPPETHNIRIGNFRREPPARPASPVTTEDETVMSSTAKDNVLAAIAGARQKTVTAREKRKSKGGALAYEKIWQDAYEAAYPEERHFVWTRAQQAIFKRALQRGVPDNVIRPFIEYVVTDFGEIVRQRFSWMKGPPALPNPEFVSKNIAVMFQAFQDRNDPNRKLKRQIATSGKRTQPQEPGEDVSALKERLALLEQENKRLKVERAVRRGEEAVERKKTAKRLVLKRRTRDDEFGSWDD